MAITTDWQGNLRTLTFGASTNYPVLTDGISGLGIPRMRAMTSSRGQGHGVAGSYDRLDLRRINFPFRLTATDASTVQGYVEDMKEAFAPSDTDLELQLRIPGTPETVMSYFGRPRESPLLNSLLAVGTVDFLGAFDALDPLAYGAETTDLNNTGSFTVTNDGTAPTDRCTITVTSDGVGPMTLQNTDSIGSRTIEWSSTLSNGTVRVINLRTGLVTTSGGSDRTSELNNTTSRLWPLVAGDNDIVATNMSDVDLTFRPAWY